MKIVIKTLQNRRYDLEIDPKDTVFDIKYKIEKQLNLGWAQQYKFIHKGRILKDDQTAESANIAPDDYAVVMVRKSGCLRLEIDDKCYMSEGYYKQTIRAFKTLKDFQTEISTHLDDDINEFCKYYDFFIDGASLKVVDEDKFGDNCHNWLIGSVTLQIRTKDNKLWYKQHYDKRLYLLVMGYIRITTKGLQIFLPPPMQELCNTYYRKGPNI